MGPARFLCATLLRETWQNWSIEWLNRMCSSNDYGCYSNFSNHAQFLFWNARAFVAQWLEHWSCKPGVESSNLSEGFCKGSIFPQYTIAHRHNSPLIRHNLLSIKSNDWHTSVEKASPNVGLEPTTLRLRVWCSTDWASRAMSTKHTCM